MAKDIKKLKPDISVIMPVFDGEKYLRESIDSILTQTYKNFEFIIINDGSRDNTLDIIKSYKDPRIVLINRENRGIVESLNEGINKARGTYIARQDDDDISTPERLKDQIKKIHNDKSVLVSSAFSMFYESTDNIINTQCLVDNDKLLKRELYVQNPFGHGATMFRRDKALDVGLYREIGPAEDFDLWARLSNQGTFSYIEEINYYWRINPDGISQKKAELQNKTLLKVQDKILKPPLPRLTSVDIEIVIMKVKNLESYLKVHALKRIMSDQKLIIKRYFKTLNLQSLFINTLFLVKLYIMSIKERIG